jgi:hypothetical protein
MRRWEDLREVILQGLTDAPDIATLAEQFCMYHPVLYLFFHFLHGRSPFEFVF